MFHSFNDAFIFLVDKEIRVLRDKICQDCNKLPVRDLCTKRAEKYYMNFFNLDDKFDEMVSKVIKIKDSRIFNVLWKEYGESLKDEVVTMEIIWCQMWSRICEELRSICKQLYNGEMKLRKVDEYLDIFKNDNDAIINEFIQLSEFFNPNMGQLDQIRKQLEDIIEKMKSYKKLFNTQQAADAVLRLQKVMGLEGDFSQVQIIEKVWPTFFTFHSVTRAETRTLIWGGGVYIHIFMFYPTSFFSNQIEIDQFKKKSVGRT